MPQGDIYKLRDWSVMANPNPYCPPECQDSRLVGHRYAEDGEAVDDSGHRIISSPIVSCEGRFITTKSGTVYVLEDPDPEYVKFCASIGKVLDEKEPIKFIK